VRSAVRIVRLIAVCAGVGAGAPAQGDLKPLDASATLIRGVTVLTMSERGRLDDHSVLIEEGVIRAVAPMGEIEPPANARVIEGAGRVLVPGFTDLHVHFPPFVGSEGDASWRMVSLLLANGVTTARGMQGHATHIELRRRLLEGELLGPTIHVAGPAITAQSASTPEAARRLVDEHADAGFDFIKSHRVINPEVYDAVIAAGKERKIPVAGHVDNEVGLERALQTGQQIEHLDAFFAAIVKDKELATQFGQVVPAALRDAFDLGAIPATAKAIADAKVTSGPTMALFRVLARAHEPAAEWAAREELKYVTSGARQQWLAMRQGLAQPALFGDPAHAKWFVDARDAMLRAIVDAGGRVLVSSDAPQVFLVAGFATHDEMKAMTQAGLSAERVLAAATRDAAAYFAEMPNRGSAAGVEPDFGVIAAGKRADLVLLREDPTKSIDATRSIDAVIVRGRVLDRADLDVLLEKVEKSARAAG
jgi:imidazolonepropionase-like amidohydrolase